MNCPRCGQPSLQMDHQTWVDRVKTGKVRVYCIMCAHDWWVPVRAPRKRRG